MEAGDHFLWRHSAQTPAMELLWIITKYAGYDIDPSPLLESVISRTW